jgi:hypothetical protein
MDPVTITSAIGAATAAVGLFDKIADQVERFLTQKEGTTVPQEHRLKIESANDGRSIVARSHGQVIQTITAQDLEKLPESQLQHVKVLEQSMENHYAVWASVYPQLALSVDPVAKARTEQQLRGVIQNMKGDLNATLGFLQSCGLYLDDHYMHIRDLVNRA